MLPGRYSLWPFKRMLLGEDLWRITSVDGGCTDKPKTCKSGFTVLSCGFIQVLLSCIIQWFIQQRVYIEFFQEGWKVGRVCELSTQAGKLMYNNQHGNLRVCLWLIHDNECFPISEFVSKDLLAMVIEFLVTGINVSTYFPSIEEGSRTDEFFQLSSGLRTIVKH